MRLVERLYDYIHKIGVVKGSLLHMSGWGPCRMNGVCLEVDDLAFGVGCAGMVGGWVDPRS